MNRVLREHYPAARLPEDLRRGLDLDALVTVSIVVEGSDMDDDLSLEEILALGQSAPRRSIEEIDEELAALRAEWCERN